MRNLLWYLIAGTRGGETRGKILMLIKNNPANANKIAELLKLDYKTVRHHLAILEKNNLLITTSSKAIATEIGLSLGELSRILKKEGLAIGTIRVA